MTAWDVQLAELENTRVGGQNRRYRPSGSSRISNDNSNSRDQISPHVFKPGVETCSDHFLSGRPGSDSKSDDARPRYEPRHHAWRIFHPAFIRCFVGRATPRSYVGKHPTCEGSVFHLAKRGAQRATSQDFAAVKGRKYRNSVRKQTPNSMEPGASGSRTVAGKFKPLAIVGCPGGRHRSII
jgi:hypothetical protein